jgi:DNA-binding beta-propeller fold protein YncE
MKSINDSKATVGFILFTVVSVLLGEQDLAAYCSASGGCDEYIKSVQVGAIQNTGTGCGNYVDYTFLSTTMEIGQDYAITVTNSDVYYQYDWCGIWVDWNQNDDFDPNETVSVSGDWHTFTATITPPGDAASGNTRMRVRIRWTGDGGTLEPCGPTPYGEVEDYTIIVPSSGPQTRIYGKKWHDLNDNGQMDGGEPALSGWTVFLDEDLDGEIDPNDVVTTTDIQGNYEFTGMEPNEYYYVSELGQAGWINTYPGAGGIHYRIWIEEGNDIELNFGNYHLHNGDVNGFKFNDVNNNGVWNDGEEPLSGWEIYIDENQNGQWDSGEPRTTTSAAGYYEFTDLEPGYYNIMEVPQAGWFQTYPGITSGRLWGLEGRSGDGSTIAEVDLGPMTIEDRFAAPFNSIFIGGGCLAAGPSTLFYCPLRLTSMDTADSLFFEMDCETGLVLHEGVLEMPENEIAWASAWHNGILYVISVVVPLPGPGEPWVAYLNGYDAQTKRLVMRESLIEGAGDGIAGDPYIDVLISSLFVKWTLYEIDPVTAQVVKRIGQKLVIGVSLAYTEGVLYKTHWARDDIHALHREDGSLISSDKLSDYVGFDAIAGGIGVRGGHRVWIGKRDVTANFGNRLDSEGSLSGAKYEDLNGNGQRDANEPGMADWTIYVDLDGDMDLDASEPATVTDANGNWTIDGLVNGRYFVREVQQKGYTCTEPALGWIDHIDIRGPRDIVFDNLRNLLYVSTEAGQIERFNLSTNQFLSPIAVGGSPHGMDMTADYKALYVADTQLSDGNGIVHKVNIDTLNVTDLAYSVGQFEDGSYDIAIGSEGIALITGSFGGSGWVPLYVLDTSDDTITVRPDVLGRSEINDDVRVVRSYDRSTIWLINNSSNGWIGVYDAPSDTFTGEKEYHDYLNQSPVALNYDGSMAAIQLYRHCIIVDSDFNTVVGLDDSKMGAEFDPSSDLFYQFQQRWNILFALDTVVWELLDYVSIGGITETYERFTRGETAITADGRVLGITDPNYVALHRKEHYTPALPGRRISGLDFGNKTVLCGDIDGDRDVDFSDLGCLCEDWLRDELSMDVTPAIRDHVVNMPDFARFANAWRSQKGDSNWDMLCDAAPAGGDEAVDNKDLKVLTEQWLLDGLTYDSDLAGTNGPDGHVDLMDFACLGGNWGIVEKISGYDEDFETGDFSNLPWEHGGDAPWTIDSFEHFEGSYSAKSADLPRYSVSILSVTAACGQGEVYFMLKSGSGGTFRFSVDGGYVFDWTDWEGDLDWALVMIPVGAGIHTFEWSYQPDGFGEDHAWIDAIRFPPAND